MRAPNRAKFCTVACYFESRRAYSAALSDGTLEAFLTPQREAAIRKRKNWAPDDYMARKLADRTGWREGP
jgi:hypothetical protein